MKRQFLAIVGAWVAAGLAAPAYGGMVVEWWGKQAPCRHKGMKVAETDDGDRVLTFDLSALKPPTAIYHASLRPQTKVQPPRKDKRAYMSIGRGVFYYDPLSLYAMLRPSKPILIYAAGDEETPLKLEAPQFQSFDATEAVRAWVAGKRPNKGFLVKRLERWVPDRTVLEIRYEGAVTDPPKQAGGIKVVHRKGQTFITWTEAEKIITKEEILWPEFRATFKKHGPRQGKFYRIYRHDKPITAGNLHQARRIDEIWPLSGYDVRMHQHKVRGENWIGLDPEVRVRRYVVEDPPAGVLKATGEDKLWARRPRAQWFGKQLPLHTGLYVHQVSTKGKAHYAVTAIVGGVENTRDVTAANSLAKGVEETVAAGEPIFYRWLDQSSRRGRVTTVREGQFFVYWAASPYANQPRRPIHIIVGLVGPKPGANMRVRYNMRNMYGNEIIRGVHSREWRDHDRLLTILCDGSYMTKGYYDSWNTLRPKRAPSRHVAYSPRLEKLLAPWALKLTKRAPLPPQAK